MKNLSILKLSAQRETSCGTGGAEIRRENQVSLGKYPIIYQVLAPSQVVSRISEPSTVPFVAFFFLGGCGRSVSVHGFYRCLKNEVVSS